MEDRSAPFAPARLDPADLQRPVTRGQRALPNAELERLRQQHRAREVDWRRLNPRMIRRLKLYSLGAVLTLPFVFRFILMPVSFSFWHLPIYALFGVYLAYMRPTPRHAVPATFALAAALALTAPRVVFSPFSVFYCVLGVLGVGYAIGVIEESKLGDG